MPIVPARLIAAPASGQDDTTLAAALCARVTPLVAVCELKVKEEA